MTGRRMIAFVLAFLLIAAPWSSATAEPILYTITFAASGSVDGVPFTDEPLVFAGVTDTDTVTALTEADITTLKNLIIAIGYVGGFALTIASIFQFKQHKDNPTQQRFAVQVSLPESGLTLPVVRDGALKTLTIDSILDNTLELRTHHVAGGL